MNRGKKKKRGKGESIFFSRREEKGEKEKKRERVGGVFASPF